MALRLKSLYDSEIAIDGELIPLKIRRFTPAENVAFNRDFERLGMGGKVAAPGPDASAEERERWANRAADSIKFIGDAITNFVTVPEGHILNEQNQSVTRGADLVVELAPRDGVLNELLFLIWLENKFSEPDKRQRKRRLAPFVPTPAAVAERMMQIAKVGAADTLMDLGCGNGQLCIAAAKAGARAFGYDIDPQRIDEAKAAAAKAGVADRCTFEQTNAMDVDLRPATVVALYLLSAANLKLQPKLLRELQPGARVISHAFEFGSWWDAEVIEHVPLGEGEEYAHSGQRWIYLYDVDKGRQQVQTPAA